MKRNILLFVLVCTLPAWAQFTTVTGTVTDPNGLPYSYGTISERIVSSGTPTFTATGALYLQPSQATGLDATGTFQMRLADVTALTPGGSTYTFTVCSGTGTVPFSFGKGPICFTVTGISISGASQSITATLTAAALALTVNFGGGGSVSGSGLANQLAKWTGTSTLAGIAAFTESASVLSLTENFNFGTPGNGGNFITVNNSPTNCGGTATYNLQLTFGCTPLVLRGSVGSAQSAGNVLGLYAQANQNVGTGTLGFSAGGFFENDGAGTTITNYQWAAMAVNASLFTPAGSVPLMGGVYAFSSNKGGVPGNITIARNSAVDAQTEMNTSFGATTTTDATVYVRSPSFPISGSNMTHHYGIFLEDQTNGGTQNPDPWGIFVTAGGVTVGPHTFSTLPTCNAAHEGRMEAVTDATSATNGTTVAGAGAHHVLAYCNSVNWLVVVGS